MHRDIAGIVDLGGDPRATRGAVRANETVCIRRPAELRLAEPSVYTPGCGARRLRTCPIGSTRGGVKGAAGRARPVKRLS